MRRIAFVVLVALGCGGSDYSSSSSSSSSTGGGLSGTGSGSGSDSAWKTALVGSYESGTRVENNIAFSSEDVGLDLRADGTYRLKTGKNWSSAGGAWSVSSTALSFSGGSSAGKSVPLSNISEGCRVLEYEGKKLFRSDLVAACPKKPAALSTSECRYVGTWSRSSGTSVSTDDSVTLEKDRFFSHESGRTTCTSYGNTTKCLRNSSRPVVGTWKLVGSTLQGPPDVKGWRFEAGEGNCGAPPSGAGGTGGGTAGGSTGTGSGGAGGGSTVITLCRACTADSDCASSEFCGRRRCDARAGCYPRGGGASCSTISGQSCPASSLYDACTADSDCSSNAACLGFGSAPTSYQCLQGCQADSDCVAPPGDTSATMVCASTTPKRCLIRCSSATAVCPGRSRCLAWTDGSYGFCG